MKLSYIIHFACKNLFGHKLRTFLTVMGVSISVSFIIILMSFTFGIEKIATNQIADGQSMKNIDVVRGSSKVVKINVNTIDKILGFSEVDAVYPQVSIAGDIKYNESKVDTVIYGVNRKLLAIIKPQMVAGKYFKENDQSGIVINATVANRLTQEGIDKLIGKKITIQMVIRPDLVSRQGAKTEIKSTQMTIAGVTKDGKTPYIFVPIDIIRDFGVDQFSELKVVTKNSDDVEKVKSQIEFMGYKTSAVKNTIDQVTQFFGLLRLIFISLGMISGIVALLGIFNTMTISLMEKTREVGLMKILGLKKRYIRKLFLIESALIGFFGSVIGVAVGVAVDWIVNYVVEMIAVNGGNLPVKIMYLPYWVVIMVLVASLLVSMITGLYPSKRATKISPLDALRYE